jgi:hypothetical protein
MGFELISRSLAVLALTAGATVACNRDAVANQRADKPAALPTPEEASQLASVGKAQFDESAFNLGIAPRAAIEKGQSGELVVVLTAKPPYHVNKEYPHRFKVTATRGLTTPSSTIQRDPAKVSPARLELLVPVTLEQNGPHGLEGELSFSLCTEEKCLMEKRSLTFTHGSQ